jgi:Cytochrome P450
MGRRARHIVALGAAALAVAVALTRLPARVVALRMWLFARINGDEGVPVPGPLVDTSRFREVYAHPAADGRSRGAALSDLFWYWLSPGAEVHQEHLEPGPRYDEVARTTRRVLALPADRVPDLVARHAVDALAGVARARRVRLRDLAMPLWAGVFAEVVFGAPCGRETRDLIVANADDVVSALKCTRLRHMDRRHRLTRHLEARLGEVAYDLPACLTPREQALYLQGTYFNTAVVQMSEATAHVLMVLAAHPGLQAEVAAAPDDDDALLGRVVDETLRLYPLFGVAHRITSADISVDGTTLPAGSVLCFSYPAFHRAGWDEPDRFDPGRWERCSSRDANFIPFGVPANRPCPAWHLAPIALRAAVREVLARVALFTAASHTRSLPNRGPCLVVPRGGGSPPDAALAAQRLQDRAEDAMRSVLQLVLGTYMVWDARRQALCRRHFGAGASG